MITYLCHAPSQAVFHAVMNALVHPVDGLPLMAQDEDGRWIAHPDVIVSEIGPIVTVDPVTGETVKFVPGHHVNIDAIGPLERHLTGEITLPDGTVLPAIDPLDEDGTLKRAVDRSRILALLGTMSEVAAADGVPAGEAGSSGMRIIDETLIATPALISLPVGTDR